MAITERYVSSSGTDTYANSTNPATPMSLSTALTNMVAGDRINIKADGTYSRSATDTLTPDGTTTSPITLRGYTTTIGDATLGRASGGFLDTTKMPVIAYGSTFRLNAAGSTNIIFESLNITSNVANSAVRINVESLLVNCKIDNASTSSSAVAIEGDVVTSQVISCDLSLSAGVASAKVITTAGPVQYSRITGGGGNGIELASNPTAILGNVIYESAIGIRALTAASRSEIIGNTIANCTGDGIDIVTSTTALVKIVGNHITGCGGYGIDFNASTCSKVLINNRFRDNTSGDINGGGDYQTATNVLNQTSDDTDALDFTSQSTDDYSLLATAAGARRGLSYLQNIGANGTQAASGGGGSAIQALSIPGVAIF